MAMVMPRSRSSGALSIWSKAVYFACPLLAKTLVIAAVSVVLPWSMCPIVPTFTCGLLRTNFCFPMKPETLLCVRVVPAHPSVAASVTSFGVINPNHLDAHGQEHNKTFHRITDSVCEQSLGDQRRNRWSPRWDSNP